MARGSRYHPSRMKVGFSLKTGGSFAIAAVCKDGMLVAADSRSTIRDEDGRKLAYYDGVQKVFPIGKAALTYTGLETIQNVYFGFLVDAFTQSMTEEVPIDNLLPTFLNFAESSLSSDEARTQLRHQRLISAGFLADRPMACYYNEAQTVGPKYACGFGLVSSDRTIIDDYKPRLKSMGARNLGCLIREAISLYAKDKGSIEIGGQVYIVLVSHDYPRWLDIRPSPRRWNYLHEFASAYWKGDVDLQLLPGVTRSEVEDCIRRGEAWSKGDRLS